MVGDIVVTFGLAFDLSYQIDEKLKLKIKLKKEMSRPTTTTCSLCLEDIPVEDTIALTFCRHESCKSCMSQWLAKEESRGSTMATCPFCRASLSDNDVIAILGRQLKPVVARAASSLEQQGIVVEDEVDELSLHWLEEHTKQCRGCGARIQKKDGCNHMTCRCGYEFCYNCGCPVDKEGVELCEGECEYVQKIREKQHTARVKEVNEFWSSDKGLGIVWLFLSNEQGLRLLANTTSKEAVRRRLDLQAERNKKRLEMRNLQRMLDLV